ncbi:MAG: glycosyltransferase family 39 protein [Nanoarchaeota archaeon]|nr:glycosyltransferase family 39 protein [Nanoarchaeota archaeon]
MDVLQRRKEKLFAMLKSKKAWVTIAILILAFVLRYLVAIEHQPPAQWWDSGDYMTAAKEIAGITHLDSFTLNPRRPFLLSVLWAVLLKLGGNDTTLMWSSLIFSLAAVWLLYLLAKRLFNQPVAWITAFLVAVSWQNVFHTGRLLTDIPSLTFWLAAAYFFWMGYGEERSSKDLVLAGMFFGLAWFTRAASLIYVVPLFAVIFMKDHFLFVKQKRFWLFVLLALVAVAPFVVWLFSTYDNPIQKFTGLGGSEQRFAGRWQFHYLWDNLGPVANDILTPSISNVFFSAKFLGLLILLVCFWRCLHVFLGFDVLWKTRDKELLKRWFLLTWLLIPFVFYSLAGAGVEDRYLLGMFPVIFMFFGDAVVSLLRHAGKLKTVFWCLAIAIILFVGSQHIATGYTAAVNAKNGFAEVAYAGEWMKQNSNVGDAVITASKYQNLYYSERETYGFMNTSADKENASSFLYRLRDINPKFVVLSVYESAFTPQWAYQYPQQYQQMFIAVQGYLDAQQNPRLVVYYYNASANPLNKK